ncbi:Gag-Pro-Pol polyprotein, partial [Dictyocoela muelleri]
MCGGRKVFILTITDICTRFTKVKVITKITSKPILKAFKKIWFDNYGVPKKILTDHGKQYVSRDFKDSVSRMGIVVKHSTILNPTGNSISERVNKTINEIMRMYA